MKKLTQDESDFIVGVAFLIGVFHFYFGLSVTWSWGWTTLIFGAIFLAIDKNRGDFLLAVLIPL